MDASSAAQRSRSEYTQRMNRVMDYIDSHLAGKMDLSALASVAHFSPFHFHRLFAAWTGATLGDYVRRRRLDVAGRHATALGGRAGGDAQAASGE
jgi:AraC family transcriptional regulator